MAAERRFSGDAERDAAIADAASRWLARRDRGLSPNESIEFHRWIEASPRHGAELARLEQAWREFDQSVAVPELVAMAAELDQATRQREPKGGLSRLRWLAASAAAIALIAGITWWQAGRGDRGKSPDQTGAYRVLASSAREVKLDDGSKAEVRDDGEIRAIFSPAERRVELVRGEAHFTVAPDPDRPFVVLASGTIVRAVGTAFDVRLEPGRVDVLVTEGTVEVLELNPDGSAGTKHPESVVAGQRARIELAPSNSGAARKPSVEISAAAPADVEQVLGWQSTRLVFDRTPLADAVEAFNRHASGGSGTLVIGDDALRARRIGGTFRAANVEGFVRLLERGGEVRAERRENEIVLRGVP